MQTTRIISNISYNTLPFFEDKIKDLVARGIIDWAYWIKHNADEDDEKDHIHFVLKPAKRLDTSSLRDFFNEVDINHDKPLTCTMRWYATNSLDDWLLYAIHHPAYLSSKGQYRNEIYDWKDVKTTDEYALKHDIANIDLRKYLVLQWLEDAVRSNTPFFVLVQQGIVPISQRTQYEYQYRALQRAVGSEEQDKRWDELVKDGKVEYIQDAIPNLFDNHI